MLKGVSLEALKIPQPPDEVILKSRGCYCFIWEQTHEGALNWQKDNLEKGVTKGYCGECDCGKPGHVCHYPGPVPFTGCWCDDCYLKEYKEQTLANAIRERRRQRAMQKKNASNTGTAAESGG